MGRRGLSTATSLLLIAGMWLYRADRIAIQGQIDKLLPYKDVVTELRSDPELLLREHEECGSGLP